MSTQPTPEEFTDSEALTGAYFPDRYPELPELLFQGGTPGVTYALIAPINTGRFQKWGWSQIRDLPLLHVGGQSGIMLMGKGEPIRGASPQNGFRVLMVDRDLPKLTGIAVRGHELADVTEASEAEIAKAKAENAQHAGQKRGGK